MCPLSTQAGPEPPVSFLPSKQESGVFPTCLDLWEPRWSGEGVVLWKVTDQACPAQGNLDSAWFNLLLVPQRESESGSMVG